MFAFGFLAFGFFRAWVFSHSSLGWRRGSPCGHARQVKHVKLAREKKNVSRKGAKLAKKKKLLL